MRRKTTQKSARFPVRLCSNLYPNHYSSAFAFSAIPYPHSQQLPLRFTCPKAAIRAYHVPCLSHDWFRVRLFAGDPYDDVPPAYTEASDHLPFGSSLTAVLACL